MPSRCCEGSSDHSDEERLMHEFDKFEKLTELVRRVLGCNTSVTLVKQCEHCQVKPGPQATVKINKRIVFSYSWKEAVK